MSVGCDLLLAECVPGTDPLESSLTLLSVCLSLQVGNNDVDDVNIIVFRQINQFDLSGNVITSSEYLSTLWVRILKKTQNQWDRCLSHLALALACYKGSWPDSCLLQAKA